MLLQVAEQILRLLAGELRLLDHPGDRRGGQEPSFLPFGDHALQLLHVHHGRLGGGQQTLQLLGQFDSQGPLRIPVEAAGRHDLPRPTLSLLCVAFSSAVSLRLALVPEWAPLMLPMPTR